MALCTQQSFTCPGEVVVSGGAVWPRILDRGDALEPSIAGEPNVSVLGNLSGLVGFQTTDSPHSSLAGFDAKPESNRLFSLFSKEMYD